MFFHRAIPRHCANRLLRRSFRTSQPQPQSKVQSTPPLPRLTPELGRSPKPKPEASVGGNRSNGIVATSNPQGTGENLQVTNNDSNNMESRWNQAILRILDKNQLPVGSFDLMDWEIAEVVLLWCSSRGNNGLTTSLKILDRLVEESKGNENYDFRLDISYIHAVIKNWCLLVKKSKTNILPSFLEAKITAYAKVSKVITPVSATYGIILDGASHCPIPSERLEFTASLLERLIVESENNPLLRPDVVTFGTVINALSRMGGFQQVKRAEEILRRVKELHEQGWSNVRPNVVMYTAIINGWAQGGMAKFAESWWQEMYEDYAIHGNKDAEPNVKSFNTVLTAWAKSPSPNASETIEALLKKMEMLHESKTLASKPDIVSYNCLLTAYSKKIGDASTANKAMELVETMSKRIENGDDGVRPDMYTFALLFRTIVANGAENRESMTERALKLMARLGLQPNKVVSEQLSKLKYKTT